MALTITHTWTCDICGDTDKFVDQYRNPGDTILQYHRLPPGWCYLPNRQPGTGFLLVCPKHTVTIDDAKSDPK